MRYLSLFFFFSLALISCKTDSNPTEENPTSEINAESLKGKFIRVSDNDRGGIEEGFKLIKEIEFKGNFCHFNYVTIKMSGKYEVDEGFVYIETGGELGILSLEIVGSDQLEGEGFIHGTFKREGTFDPSILDAKKNVSKTDYTKPKVSESSIEQKSVNVSTPSNDPSSSNNPIGSSNDANSSPFGEGGTGSGSSYGYGSGNGVDGNGPTTNARIRLNEVQLNDLNYNQDVSIYLKLVIDAEGNVVSASNVSGKSTTTDPVLINKILYAVRKQVKYNKDPGASFTSVYYTVRIDAN